MIATQIESENITEGNRDFFLANLKRSDTNILLLSICEFFYTGEERKRELDNLRKNIDYFRANGYEPIIWTNSLGYGVPHRDKDFESRFSSSVRLTSFEGYTSAAVCTLDEDFRLAMCDNVRDFIKAGAKSILWDDDLVQSVRPGAFCCCEKHRKKFFEKTGKNYTPEQLRDLFAGNPSEERSAFLDVMGESLTDFCKALRAAADEISPEVNMGLCASFTHYDIEGVNIKELINVLAGKNRRPFFRLSGAPYWAVHAQRFPGQSIGAIAEFVKMQAAWFVDSDISLLDENDPFPRDTRIVPVSICEIYDKISQTIPGLIRHKYFMCFNPESGDTAYLEEHIRNMERDKKLGSFLQNKTPCGIRIYQSEHLLSTAKLPETYPGDWAFMSMFSQPYAGIFAALNGFATKYSGSGAGICFGENARNLTESEISQGLVLDMKAALILKERGYDTGIETAQIADGFNGRFNVDSTVVRNELVYQASADVFTEPNGIFYDVKAKKGAETKATLRTKTAEIPYCIQYKNDSGMKFSVLCFDADSLSYGISGGEVGILFSPTSKSILQSSLEFVSGKHILSTTDFRYGEHLSVSSDGHCNYAVLLCNAHADARYDISVHFDGNVKIIDCDGEWSDNGKNLTCNYLPAYGFASVCVSVENNAIINREIE